MCTNRLWLERCYWERKDGDARETCPPPETVCLLSHESALVCSELYETNLSVSGHQTLYHPRISYKNQTHSTSFLLSRRRKLYGFALFASWLLKAKQTQGSTEIHILWISWDSAPSRLIGSSRPLTVQRQLRWSGSETVDTAQGTRTGLVQALTQLYYLKSQPMVPIGRRQCSLSVSFTFALSWSLGECVGECVMEGERKWNVRPKQKTNWLMCEGRETLRYELWWNISGGEM